MKVDYKELAKQMKEEALNADRYVKVEIVVPCMEDKLEKMKKGEPFAPYMNLSCKGCGPLEMGSLLVAMDALKKQIVKEHPEAILARILFTDGGTFSHNEKTGETNFDKGEI